MNATSVWWITCFLFLVIDFFSFELQVTYLMDSMTNLETEALKRKKRLEALRNQQQQDQRQQTNESKETTPLPK